jgi:hypothetical protein
MSIPEDTRRASEAALRALEEYNPRPEIDAAIRKFRRRRAFGACASFVLALLFIAWAWVDWRAVLADPEHNMAYVVGQYMRGMGLLWAMQRFWRMVAIRRQAMITAKQTLGFWILVASGAGMAFWAFTIGVYIANHLPRNAGDVFQALALYLFTEHGGDLVWVAIVPFVLLGSALSYGMRLIRESTEEVGRA